MAVLLGAIKRPWSEYIKPHLKKLEKSTNSIFKSFEKERKLKNISSVDDSNKLWRAKYKEKFDKIEKKSDEEYRKLWYKFHQK